MTQAKRLGKSPERQEDQKNCNAISSDPVEMCRLKTFLFLENRLIQLLKKGSDKIVDFVNQFQRNHRKDTLELSEAQKKMFKKPSVTSIYPDHYIIKVNGFNDIARDRLDEWVYFFKNSEIKEEFKARGLAEAREKLKEINLTGKELAAYRYYLEELRYEASIAATIKFEEQFAKEEGWAEGWAEGLEEGRAEGRAKSRAEGRAEGEKEKVREIAKQLKNERIDIEIIVKSTELSRTEIEKL